MNAEPQEQVMRGMTYSVQKILKRLYRHVTVLDSQIEQVRPPTASILASVVSLVLVVPLNSPLTEYLFSVSSKQLQRRLLQPVCPS
jgi:hypothetical protein